MSYEDWRRHRAQRVRETLRDAALLSAEVEGVHGFGDVLIRLDRPDADRLCEMVREGR